MVAGCPKCRARYRVDAERIGPEGAKLRCTKCSAVFLVRPPQAAPNAPQAAPNAPQAAPNAPQAAPNAPQAAPNAPQAAPNAPTAAPDAPPTAPAEPVDRARLVIVADSDEARGKACAEAVRSWGLTPHFVPDGVEAMLAIQRMLPRAVVLDAGLPKMFGFQVCEVIKRNESLRDTVVVLVGAVHHQARYRRDPSDLYGADVYIEQPDLPEGLEPIFREAGLPIGAGQGAASGPPATAKGPSPAASESVSQEAPAFDDTLAPPPPSEAAAPTSRPMGPAETGPSRAAAAESAVDSSTGLGSSSTGAGSPSTGAAAGGDPAHAEERERAERLARIAVSEMLLYQPEKFERGIVDGNLEQVLDLEIQEARALLRQRISEAVRSEADFVMDELQRVAAERDPRG